MNEALAMPKNLGGMHVGEMLALIGLPSERQEKRLSASAAQIIRCIASVVDELLTVVINRRTAAEFRATREELFPKYFHSVRALSDIARVVIPRHVLESIAAESFSRAEAELRDQGLEAFGAAVRDQAIFTVWTLRKISDLCQRIDGGKLTGELRESDHEIFQEYVYHAISSRFHLQCLLKSMEVQEPMYPEVLEAVIDGLRGAVNAYALARRALDLRVHPTESEIRVKWDDEDQQLLNEATFDMLAEPL